MFEFDWDAIRAEYRQEIVAELQNLGYSPSIAQSIFDRYKSVIERCELDTDWCPKEFAEELHKAVNENHTPKAWHEHLDWIDEMIAEIDARILAKQQKKSTRPRLYIKRYLTDTPPFSKP